MTRLTIEIDDEVAERVGLVAAELGVAPERPAGEVISEQFSVQRETRFVDLAGSADPGHVGANTDLRGEGAGGSTADDVFGDLETKTVAAIAGAVEDRRRRGLPIAVDRGNGVEFLAGS